MSGGNQSKVKVVLRNPFQKKQTLDYDITLNDTRLAQDWRSALKHELRNNKLLEKNFCFMGFPHSPRNLNYLCTELNQVVFQINMFNASGQWQYHGLDSYVIEDYFTPDVVRFGDEYPVGYDDANLGLGIKHEVMNKLHNHFEVLQGTVEHLSEYYRVADYETKYAIRQLNNICHELESLVLSQRKLATTPEFVRPSQITTFLHADRFKLRDEHRIGFLENGYDRKFGGVYMHWTQIGKTLMEVFRDEHAPELTDTVCEAITHLQYWSGEFDVEWGVDIVRGGDFEWHNKQMAEFDKWLADNDRNPEDSTLSLGYLQLGDIDLRSAFGTVHPQTIWQHLSKHLDIARIEIDDVVGEFDYCWSDHNYKHNQIEMMKPGYDYSSRRL